jgi:anti-sigma regulatory factor (Ser/Thr protein kinase)
MSAMPDTPLVPVNLCPLAPPAQGPSDLPQTVNIAYSFTVPGEPYAAAVVRKGVQAVLRTHRVPEDLAWPVVQAVSELFTCACRFAPGEKLYVSLRSCDGRLRAVVWDPHAGHDAPDMTAACRRRRRGMLITMACVAAEWDGEWGVEGTSAPCAGTKLWASFPYAVGRSWRVRDTAGDAGRRDVRGSAAAGRP